LFFKLTKVALVFKGLLGGLTQRLAAWFALPKFHMTLVSICVASVLLTCAFTLTVIGWLQRRDAIAVADSNLDKTLAAVVILINTAQLDLLCGQTVSMADTRSGFVSVKGVVNCTIPLQPDYASLIDKALEGGINPYDQFYTLRWNEKLFRVKSISVDYLKTQLVVTVGEPIWLFADRLINFGVMLLIIVLLLIILGGFASIAAVRAHLKPLTIMSQEIMKIHFLHKQAKLGHKLSLPTTTEELNSVALAFNELLGTLEANLMKYHEFASNAAHEIRTALMVISSIAQRSILQSSSGLQMTNAMADILDEVDHINRLTQGLLLLAQLENRSKEIDVSPELLHPIVAHCVDTMTALAEDKGQILMMLSFERIEVWANLTMLRQALLNLIHNAIVHCEKGNTIKIVLVSSLPNTTTIAVCDDGKGIPLDMQESIFDRFATVARKGAGKAGNTPHRGLGLGLSIARALVEAQGGTLTLQSELNKGSKFLINIPTAGFYSNSG
jgi:signal transduction histidine kinase